MWFVQSNSLLKNKLMNIFLLICKPAKQEKTDMRIQKHFKIRIKLYIRMKKINFFKRLFLFEDFYSFQFNARKE